MMGPTGNTGLSTRRATEKPDRTDGRLARVQLDPVRRLESWSNASLSVSQSQSWNCGFEPNLWLKQTTCDDSTIDDVDFVFYSFLH